MSVLENLLSSLTGGNSPSAEHPCSNCPSDCPIAGDACPACQPYKEKLIEALYNVEHAQELRARYVLSPTGAPTGTVTCPYCGAPSANRVTCEFCGMQIGEDDGKIYVSSAAEIPNPILEAQDIIYARYAAVGGSYTQKIGYLSQIGVQKSGGFLSGLLDLLSGSGSEGLGSKMTEAEILEAAGLYGVSAAQYLSGLDNGSYLPLLEKKKADQLSAHSAGAGMAAGVGYAAQRPYRQERPASPPRRPAPQPPRRPAPQPPRRPEREARPSHSERRPDGPVFNGPNQRGAVRQPQPEPPFQPGRSSRGGMQQNRPEPPVRRNERGGTRQTPSAPPTRRANNDRSRPATPPSPPGVNRRSGGPGRRLEGPPPKPGGSDRGGGHQR